MPDFFTTVKMNTLIFTFHFRLHNSTAHLVLSAVFSKIRYPMKLVMLKI